MSAFRRDVVRVYSANALNGVLGILIVPLGVRILGREGYALFSIYAVVFAFAALVESGLTKNLVRVLALSSDPATQARQLNRVLGCYALIVVALLVTLPAAAIFVPGFVLDLPVAVRGTARWIVVIAVLEYVVSIPGSTVVWYGVAMQRFERSSRFTVVSGLYRYALMFLGLIWLRSPIAAVAFAASRRVIDLWVAPRMIGKLPPGSWRPRVSRDGLREILRDSAPLTMAQVGLTTLNALPSVLASRIFGVDSLGAFRAIFDLCSRVWFFSVGFGQVLFPKLVRLLSNDESTRGDSRIRDAITLSWVAYTCLALVGTLMAPWALAFLHLEAPGRDALFATTLLGTCISAHTQFSFELLQAGRRYRPLLGAIVAAIAIVLAATGSSVGTGLLAIGIGWLAGQFSYACLLDAAALMQLNAGRRHHASHVLAKVGAVAAIMAIAFALRESSLAWAVAGVSLPAIAFYHVRRVHGS